MVIIFDVNNIQKKIKLYLFTYLLLLFHIYILIQIYLIFELILNIYKPFIYIFSFMFLSKFYL